MHLLSLAGPSASSAAGSTQVFEQVHASKYQMGQVTNLARVTPHEQGAGSICALDVSLKMLLRGIFNL